MNGFRRVFCSLFVVALAQGANAGTLVQFYTRLGEIDAELYDQDKPVTVQNFIKLIQAGAYQNSFFHRCVPGFVLQGGGFFSFDSGSTNIIGPPYSNLGQVGNFGPITNEFKVGAFHSNLYGAIAMAKTSDPNSATSQFFFNLANNSSSLDDTNNSGGFTVFGHVLRGTNILNQFNGISYWHNLVDLRDSYGGSDSIAAIFSQLPTYALGSNAPPYDELIYFNVTLLTVQVNLNSSGARMISWTSVNGLTNRVEYATNLPPVWQLLSSTNGDGSVMSVTDSVANARSRFYRVRVLY
jgi:cyclophilin family peptidyl-prolyl cis-trans isomerase